MADYESRRLPDCPHCGKEVRDSWELFSDMEGTVETDCGSCDKPFTLTRSVVFYFSAATIAGADHG